MIAVTGHSRDLGKEIFDYYTERGYNTQGFSRSNGFNIHNPKEICDSLNDDVKVFINNARDDSFAQVNLYKYMYEHWKNTSNLIINISSLAPDWAHARGSVRMYDVQKQALDTSSKMGYYSEDPVFISNIRPSYMDTPWIHKRGVNPDRMLPLSEVVNSIDYIIQSWKRNIRIGVLEIERNDTLL